MTRVLGVGASIPKALAVSSLLLALLVPDVMALTLKSGSLPPCGHELCTCCHGDTPEGNMLCPRSSSRESPAMKACGDDSEAGSSQTIYVFETPMVFDSSIAFVTQLAPDSRLTRSWTSLPDFPPPRS